MAMVAPGVAWSAIAAPMMESSRGMSRLVIPTADGFARVSARPTDATALGAAACANIALGPKMRASATGPAKRAKRIIETGWVSPETELGSEPHPLDGRLSPES